MKKLSVFFIALLAVIVIVSSCKKDDESFGPPTLNFLGGEGYVDTDATIPVGPNFYIGVAASSNTESGKELTTIRVTRTMDNNTFLDKTVDINEDIYTDDFEFNQMWFNSPTLWVGNKYVCRANSI